MPGAKLHSSHGRNMRSNLAYDANRRRLVHGPLQPMDGDISSSRAWTQRFWQRLFHG